MCIIICKEKGKDMPSEEILKNCWSSNSDGAGIAWYDNHRVRFNKGFMTYEAFKGFLDDLTKKFNVVETSMVLHFRITSKGATCAQQCHPFPISSKNSWEKVKELNGSAPLIVAHNGTMSDIKVKSGYNDTQTFAMEYLTHLFRLDPKFYQKKPALDLIEAIIGSYNKLAFVTKNNEVVMLGNFIESNGIYYSNSGYANTYKFPTYGKNWKSAYDYDYSDYVELISGSTYTEYDKMGDLYLLRAFEKGLNAHYVPEELVNEIEERHYGENFIVKDDAVLAERLLTEFYLLTYDLDPKESKKFLSDFKTPLTDQKDIDKLTV